MEYDREFKAQAAFRQRHLQTYADRKADGIDYVKELCEFALSENTEHFAAVFGKSGSGKSALICKVMEELERKHGDKCLVLGYSCGLTPNGGNAAGMLRYFIIRLADYLGMDIKKQADYIASYIGSYMPSLKLYFFRLLAAAAEKTRVVVVADAIERFMESGEDPMIWSSGMPNKNLAIILSSGDENELYKNKYTLTGVGRAALPFVIQKIAAQYHKQVPQPVINHLAGQTPEGGYLPLYLHMLVLNMTMINRREQVIIDSYAAQGYTPMQAISAYMIEWIVDFEPLPVDEMFFDLISRASGITDSFFAKAVLGAIAVSADGLREKDLKGIFDEMGAEWSSVDFAILRQILRGALIQGDELQWKFAHRLLESAYWQRGLDNIKAMSGYVRDYMLKNTGDDFIAGCILPQLYVTGQSEEALTVIIADEGRHTEAFRRCLAKVLFTQKLNPGEASFIEKILAKALESRESGRNCRAVSALFGAEFFERIPGDFNWDKRDINLLSTALKLIPEDENDDDVRENKAMLHYILAERYYGYGRAENNLTDIFNNYSLSASARISLLNKHETEERLRDCVLSISGFIGFIAKEMNITDAVANIFEAYTSILIEYANRLKQMTACDHNFLAIMESYKSLIWAMDKMRQYDYVPQLADEGIAFCVKCYEYSRMTEFLAMASDIAKVAAESCRRLGKTELAERYYSTGVDFARTIVSDLESGTRLTSLTRDTALFYIESKDFKKAYEYMASVLEFSKELSAVYESHRTIMDSVITRVMYAEICALNGLMEQGLAEAQDVKKLIIDKMNDTAEKEADKWFSRAINVIDYIKNQVGIS